MAAGKRTDDDRVTTKSGTELTKEVESRLAKEAEIGFEPATLTRRHAGRPSLSGRAGHSNRVGLRVDDETYQAIRKIADQDNRNVSDVVRDALRRYLEAANDLSGCSPTTRGVDVTPGQTRGCSVLPRGDLNRPSLARGLIRGYFDPV